MCVCMCICRLMYLHLCVEAEGDLRHPSQLFSPLFSLFLCKTLKKLLEWCVCVVCVCAGMHVCMYVCVRTRVCVKL